MPGMNSGLNPGDPTLVAAFRSALLHQGAIALLMLVFLWLLWATARTWRPAASSGTGGTAAERDRGAAGAVAAPHRVRGAVDLRRDPAGAAEDGGRAGHAGHRAHRGLVPGLGPAPGQLGRHRVVVSPHPGRRGQRLDPGRDRRLAHRRGPRPLVQAGGGGQRGVGTRRVGVRRVVRRDLRARPELADRRSRRRPVLRGGRRAHRAARGRLAPPAVRAAAAGRARRVLRRDGRAPGLARPRFLAGHSARQGGHPRRDGQGDVRPRRSRTSCRRCSPASRRSPPATASRSTWSW